MSDLGTHMVGSLSPLMMFIALEISVFGTVWLTLCTRKKLSHRYLGNLQSFNRTNGMKTLPFPV
jgi:hypothetical protein